MYMEINNVVEFMFNCEKNPLFILLNNNLKLNELMKVKKVNRLN
jgi:hypothetical protein